MEEDDFLDRLEESRQSTHEGSVMLLCKEQANLVRNSSVELSTQGAVRILEWLRKSRNFAEMLVLSEAILYQLEHPTLRRLHAQALIENRSLLAAIEWLKRCESDLRAVPGEDMPDEYPEVIGLLGRAYKQLYSERRSPSDLQSALTWYHYLYSRNPEAVWHGINVVCLAATANRHSIPLDPPIDHEKIARDILVTINHKPNRCHWDEATIAEALVALDRPETAHRFLQRYVSHSEVTAFAIASTLRQFDDLWELDEREDIYLVLIDLLRSTLMKKEGGAIVTGIKDLNRIAANYQKLEMNYEKCFTDASPMPRTWFLQLIDCSHFVGRVWHKQMMGCGTGFLLRDGSILFPGWKCQVFITCNHVISDAYNSRTPDAMYPDEATITFDSLEGPGPYDPKRYKVKRVLWESPPDQWDVTILQLEEREIRIERYEGLDLQLQVHHDRLPLPGSDRVYIVGHPNGGEMSFSFQDNEVIDISPHRIQYVAPTEAGSSGSPVFDQYLNLVAMHHAGSEFLSSLSNPHEQRKANQGIPIPALVEALRSASSATA